jgi:glycerophosphoryl diester phosphodiesterase
MEIYGHRGAAGEAPENTLGGFQHALDCGLSHVELDVRLSGDDQLVVIHDATVNRTTNHRGKVNKFTADELAAMDARRNCPPWPTREGIPTLNSVIDLLAPKLDTVQLEVKSPLKSALDKTVSKLIELVHQRDLLDKAIVTSSDRKVLHAMHYQAPAIKLGYVYERGDPFNVTDDCGCRYLVAKWSLCKQALIKQARERKLNISCWTVNDADTIRKLCELGMDSIITDYPTIAMSVIKE